MQIIPQLFAILLRNFLLFYSATFCFLMFLMFGISAQTPIHLGRTQMDGSVFCSSQKKAVPLRADFYKQ
jgi:hypothetical protein